MAKYSMKIKGKEAGPASVYAQPHTMTGKTVTAQLSNESGSDCMNEMNIAAGSVSKGNYQEPKTSGIKIRGVGAATKGVMARGPMG